MDQINLQISEGEFLLVTGLRLGKSTLARLIAGLIPEFYGGRLQGKVLLRGVKLQGRQRSALHTEVGIVFQDPERQLVMTSVEAEIAFGLESPPAGDVPARR